MRRSAAMFGPPSSSSSLVRLCPPPMEKLDVPPLSNGRVLATGLVPIEHAGRELDQARRRAAAHRQAVDLRRIDDDADRRGAGGEQRRFALHGDRLRHVSDFELEIERHALAGTETNVLADEPRESLKLGSDRVIAGCQEREGVGSAGLGGRDVRGAGLDVGGGNSGAGQDAALGVSDQAGQGRAIFLRQRRQGRSSHCGEYENSSTESFVHLSAPSDSDDRRAAGGPVNVA